MRRNAGPAWSGTVARHAPEWWPGMGWNPQSPVSGLRYCDLMHA
jgi:hypothetical protein